MLARLLQLYRRHHRLAGDDSQRNPHQSVGRRVPNQRPRCVDGQREDAAMDGDALVQRLMQERFRFGVSELFQRVDSQLVEHLPAPVKLLAESLEPVGRVGPIYQARRFNFDDLGRQVKAVVASVGVVAVRPAVVAFQLKVDPTDRHPKVEESVADGKRIIEYSSTGVLVERLDMDAFTVADR